MTQSPDGHAAAADGRGLGWSSAGRDGVRGVRAGAACADRRRGPGARTETGYILIAAGQLDRRLGGSGQYSGTRAGGSRASAQATAVHLAYAARGRVGALIDRGCTCRDPGPRDPAAGAGAAGIVPVTRRSRTKSALARASSRPRAGCRGAVRPAAAGRRGVRPGPGAAASVLTADGQLVLAVAEASRHRGGPLPRRSTRARRLLAQGPLAGADRRGPGANGSRAWTGALGPDPVGYRPAQRPGTGARRHARGLDLAFSSCPRPGDGRGHASPTRRPCRPPRRRGLRPGPDREPAHRAHRGGR